MLELPRRSFITGLVGLIAAPAIVRASSIMPIRAWDPDAQARPLAHIGWEYVMNGKDATGTEVTQRFISAELDSRAAMRHFRGLRGFSRMGSVICNPVYDHDYPDNPRLQGHVGMPWKRDEATLIEGGVPVGFFGYGKISHDSRKELGIMPELHPYWKYPQDLPE